MTRKRKLTRLFDANEQYTPLATAFADDVSAAVRRLLLKYAPRRLSMRDMTAVLLDTARFEMAMASARRLCEDEKPRGRRGSRGSKSARTELDDLTGAHQRTNSSHQRPR